MAAHSEEKYIMNPGALPPASKNFAGLEEEYASAKRSKVAVLPIPYEKTTTYMQGAKNGPQAIINASQKLELFDDELFQETFKIGIQTMDPLEINDLAPQEMVGKVAASVGEVLKTGKFPVILGGEHSITIGSVKAFAESFQNLSVLHLDAHYDMRDEYFGSRFNHGCVARRVSEMVPLVQVGVRSLSKGEKEYLGDKTPHPIKTLSVYDILEKPMWKDTVTNNLTENVYISLDVDVFDPALVPGTGTPEPGGIGWYEVLDLLKEVAKDRKVVGFDVVELSPIKGQVASDFLAAKLIYRLLGYVFMGKK